MITVAYRSVPYTAAGPPQSAAPAAPGSLTQVILKFTTVADGNEAPSFAVGRGGATVGRGSCNDISIPTDACMKESDHASIVWKEGAFHVQVQCIRVPEMDNVIPLAIGSGRLAPVV